MVATLLDGCEVGEGANVAAGALIQQGTRIPPRKIRGGVPSRYIKSHAYSFNPSCPPCSYCTAIALLFPYHSPKILIDSIELV